MVGLNDIILQFIPHQYQSFLKYKMNSEVYSVPYKNMTGNKMMEVNFEKRPDLLNFWKKGEDYKIVYSHDEMQEQMFFKVNSKNLFTHVKVLGKPVE